MDPERNYPFSDSFPFGPQNRVAAGGPSGELLPGFYYIGNATSAAPIDIDDPRWTPTTKFQDVGVNDHTTYETSTLSSSTEWTHALRVFATMTALSVWTASVYGEAVTTIPYYSTNGTDWTIWGMAPFSSVGFEPLWRDTGDPSPGAINTLYLQLVNEDGATFSEQADPRIGDWRFS